MIPISYLWRIAAGIALGFYGTWVVATIATVLVLIFRVPQVTELLRKTELYPYFGVYYATKAASFLIPLWVTIIVMDGGHFVNQIQQYLGFDFLNWFIRQH